MDADELNPEVIAGETPAVAWERLTAVGFAEIGSTNDEALARARAGAPAALLVYAEHQTAGRGRKGRVWITRPGAGLCFSLVVRPRAPRRVWPLFSLAAATALARALVELDESLAVDLKWPNDVLLEGRKVAGILVETADTPGSSGAAVIGVGVNVGPGSVPDGCVREATSVSDAAGRPILRRRLLVAFLRHFQDEYLLLERGNRHAIVENWKAMSSMWNETPVWLIEDGERVAGTTCGLNDDGALQVRLQDGTTTSVVASDVSVRTAGPLIRNPPASRPMSSRVREPSDPSGARAGERASESR